MIWQDSNVTGTTREKIADRLLTDVPTLCGNPALAAHLPLAEAAQGVALYLDQIEVIPEELDPRQSRELLAHALTDPAIRQPGHLSRHLDRLWPGNRMGTGYAPAHHLP